MTLPGPLYVAKVDGTTTTLARDGGRSVRAEVNDVGLVTSSFRYRAYGKIAQTSGSGPTVLGYAGQLVDPSGLLYMRARWYDPTTGRFLTRDPLRGDPAGPRTLNAYGYAGANPALMSDPSGLAFVSEGGNEAAYTDCDSTDPLKDEGSCAGGGGPPMPPLISAAAAPAIAHKVYALLDEAGNVVYVGLTKREVLVRAAEHARDKVFAEVTVLREGLTHLGARAVEQAVIAQRGLDNLLNRINSISPARADYGQLRRAGQEILEESGRGDLLR